MPLQALRGICPPLNFINRAAKIGWVAVSAVPVATLVMRIARKKQMKCNASKTPEIADHFIAFR
ncbi:unannotated protein [freshwater metagenome]|uniref:Unannotated protein n=1 Tax=freshwater metagenome TaxID=449393 RepID=A0A6J6EQG4_9ZZZZ